jgi:ribosomal protein S18 acetylase RimI-like enzyme
MALELVPASTLPAAERAALFTAAYEGYLLPFRIDEPTLAFMEHAFDLVPEASLLARVDGELVGLANLGLRGADAWVGGVGVVPAHRGTGVGEALMRGLIAEARSRGVERLWLEVIVENTVALRLYEKLGFAHVRDVEVWTLAGQSPARARDAAPLEDAQAFVRERRDGREPWQRADATVARLAELEPPPEGYVVDGGAAIVRGAPGRATIVQLAGAARPVLEAIRGTTESATLLNLPAGDPAAAALGSLGGEVIVRQHELVLEPPA